MSGMIFEGPARLRLEGEFVLEFRGLHGEYVEYGVIGAKHLPVVIRDYRRAGLEAMRHARQTGDLARFTAVFRQVAQVKISKNDRANSLLIELNNSCQNSIPYTLWVAVGFEGRLPPRRYLYYYAEPTDDGRCVLISLYSRPMKIPHTYPDIALQSMAVGAPGVK